MLAQNNQNNFDICLSMYGNLDVFVQFLKTNDIEDFTIIKSGDYIKKTNLTENKKYSGYSYSSLKN